ncbi:hypothetical protein D3C86_2132010 [compost metagenome]
MLVVFGKCDGGIRYFDLLLILDLMLKNQFGLFTIGGNFPEFGPGLTARVEA